MVSQEILKVIDILNKILNGNMIVTGSVALDLNNIIIRRNPVDIDIIIDQEDISSIYYKEKSGDYDLSVVEFDDNSSETTYANMKLIVNNIKVDMLVSTDFDREINDAITYMHTTSMQPVTFFISDTNNILNAKIKYGLNDTNADSKLKHLEDVVYIIANNNLLI